MTVDERRRILSEAGKLGAAALHMGTTPEERRKRTEPARLARAAKRGPRKPGMAEKIAEAERLLPTLPASERERQAAWIEQAKVALANLEEQQKKRDELRVLAEAS